MPRLSLPESAPLVTGTRPRRGPERRRSGAWKVAYADFVTALMALFIVLWMMSSGERVKASVSGYFRDPRGYTQKLGAGPAGSGEGVKVRKDNVVDVRQEIEQALRAMPEFERIRDNVKFSVTGEGLRIDLLETEHGFFFETGNPKPTEAGIELLRVLATELTKIPNKVAIEGHTDSRPYGRSDYSNWELSSDRANAARRVLEENGLDSTRISQVRGFADQRLLKKDDPTSPSNRRISIIVRNMGLDEQEAAQAEGPAVAPSPEKAPEPKASAPPASQPAQAAPQPAPAAAKH